MFSHNHAGRLASGVFASTCFSVTMHGSCVGTMCMRQHTNFQSVLSVSALEAQRRFVSSSYKKRIPCVYYDVDTHTLANASNHPTLPRLANLFMLDIRKKVRSMRLFVPKLLKSIAAAHAEETRKMINDPDTTESIPALVVVIKSPYKRMAADRYQKELTDLLDSEPDLKGTSVCVLSALQSRSDLQDFKRASKPAATTTRAATTNTVATQGAASSKFSINREDAEGIAKLSGVPRLDANMVVDPCLSDLADVDPVAEADAKKNTSETEMAEAVCEAKSEAEENITDAMDELYMEDLRHSEPQSDKAPEEGDGDIGEDEKADVAGGSDNTQGDSISARVFIGARTAPLANHAGVELPGPTANVFVVNCPDWTDSNTSALETAITQVSPDTGVPYFIDLHSFKGASEAATVQALGKDGSSSSSSSPVASLDSIPYVIVFCASFSPAMARAKSAELQKLAGRDGMTVCVVDNATARGVEDLLRSEMTDAAAGEEEVEEENGAVHIEDDVASDFCAESNTVEAGDRYMGETAEEENTVEDGEKRILQHATGGHPTHTDNATAFVEPATDEEVQLTRASMNQQAPKETHERLRAETQDAGAATAAFSLGDHSLIVDTSTPFFFQLYTTTTAPSLEGTMPNIEFTGLTATSSNSDGGGTHSRAVVSSRNSTSNQKSKSTPSSIKRASPRIEALIASRETEKCDEDDMREMYEEIENELLQEEKALQLGKKSEDAGLAQDIDTTHISKEDAVLAASVAAAVTDAHGPGGIDSISIARDIMGASGMAHSVSAASTATKSGTATKRAARRQGIGNPQAGAPTSLERRIAARYVFSLDDEAERIMKEIDFSANASLVSSSSRSAGGKHITSARSLIHSAAASSRPTATAAVSTYKGESHVVDRKPKYVRVRRVNLASAPQCVDFKTLTVPARQRIIAQLLRTTTKFTAPPDVRCVLEAPTFVVNGLTHGLCTYEVKDCHGSISELLPKANTRFISTSGPIAVLSLSISEWKGAAKLKKMVNAAVAMIVLAPYVHADGYVSSARALTPSTFIIFCHGNVDQSKCVSYQRQVERLLRECCGYKRAHVFAVAVPKKKNTNK